MATIIASLSLFLSIVVHFSSRNHNKKNEELIRHEIELIRVQLQKEKKDAKDELKANVSARMFKVGKNNWKIRIYNLGPATAKNVIISKYENDEFIHEGLITAKFPMKKMEPGQSVELSAFVHFHSKQKEIIELTWDDTSGTQNKNTIEITGSVRNSVSFL
jgi:hypothetical protein